MKSIRRMAIGLPGFAALALVVGCSDSGKPVPKGGDVKTAKKGAKHKHEHAHEGPHHGAVAEWGDEEYHVEFTVDHKKQEARVSILGPNLSKAAPIKTEKILLSIKEPVFQVELKPEPQKDDPPGTASCFVGKHEKLGKEQEFAGTISGEVNGKAYAGDFKEEPEGHGHGKK